MNAETQAVLFNAVPLIILAALYLAAGVTHWRNGLRLRGSGSGGALLFGSLGVAAGVLGITILIEREPLAGNVLVGFVAIVLAGVPLVAVPRLRPQRPAPGAREPDAALLSHRLLDAADPTEVARLLLDELTAVFELDLANLALIEDEGRAAVLIAARESGSDHVKLLGQRVALDREPSGITAAVREGTAFAVYDAASSSSWNTRGWRTAPKTTPITSSFARTGT